LQSLLVAMPLDLPIAVPNAAVRGADSCKPRSGAAGALGMVKLAAVQIAQGQVGQVEIADIPSFRFGNVAIYALAKKGELESEAMASVDFTLPV